MNEKNVPKNTTVDGCEYDSCGRMKYNPEIHENHGKPYTVADLKYICAMWKGTKKKDIAFAVGKTETSVHSKVNYLRKTGMFEHFRIEGEKAL